MKNIKYIILTIAVGFMLVVSSCKKSFYTDANVNPNAPPSVTPSALLSSAEGELAYTQGGTFDLFVTLFDQQTKGVARQSQAYYQYIVTEQDVDDPWSTWYTNVMSSCKDLMTQSDAKGYNEYGGIARLLMAYSLQVTTDAWGDEPYSQALMGVANLTPAYDASATIYGDINGLIDDAISKLSGDPGPIVPGGEDIIYAGSATQWLKFAHALRARIDIHRSKSNVAMADSALAEIGRSFGSNGDNAVYLFGTSETAGNPWYQFNEERGGDVDFINSTLGLSMAANADPRFNAFFDSTKDIHGNFTDVNEVGMGPYYGNISSPVELICYDELLFIAAEANARTGGGNAQTNYTAAITANMQKLGVSGGAITTYLAGHGTLAGNASDVDSIGAQEYIALYLNPEAWTVWRRTGSPTLVPVTGSNGVPRRFIYPETEYFRNASHVPSATLWSPKIFWDN